MNNTFPNTSPQDIPIVNIHHNPLSIERILIYWSVDGALRCRTNTDESYEHVTSRIITGNVASFGDVVSWACIGTKPRPQPRGWSLYGVLHNKEPVKSVQKIRNSVDLPVASHLPLLMKKRPVLKTAKEAGDELMLLFPEEEWIRQNL